MNICVVALGKIGLPLAVQFARAGHKVVGADISQQAVDLINSGAAPFPGEAHLDVWLPEVVEANSLRATTDTASAVADSEVVVVVVPLVVDGDGVPDFRALDDATVDISRGLRPGTLVSYETTLPVGTTRHRFAAALATATGLELGVDLFVCHSPERVFSGRIFSDLSRYPKLVGGVDRPSAERAIDFYESVLTFDDRPDLDRPNGVWDLGSAEAAELAKLAETTYRDINIAFANELATYSDRMGIDVYSVIAASNSQPFSHIHQPGIAVGGHCIPVYPRFYLAGDPHAALPAAARTKNESMPSYAAERLAAAYGDLTGALVAVLGAAYRGGVKETAFSGVFPLVEALKAAGATVAVHDPLYSDEELRSLGFEPYHFGDSCDAAVVQSDHAEYRDLTITDLTGVSVVVDGRRVLSERAFAAPAVTFIRIGLPTRVHERVEPS
ncbi:MAG: nucleotide sugar dehydrogenase [Actinobacteria bacterium]|nr:nucleotide sugar dehydrogenase [Actinomycetota bacterium]